MATFNGYEGQRLTVPVRFGKTWTPIQAMYRQTCPAGHRAQFRRIARQEEGYDYDAAGTYTVTDWDGHIFTVVITERVKA
jgi:hypothetical protein